MIISFVIPAYNEEKYLERCISAIRAEIARTKIDAEIIVVNNNSTDGTRDLATSLGVTLIDEPIRGVVAARSAGYQAASGELIANIDADTMIERGWVEQVLQEFERDKNIVALSGPYEYYDMTVLDQFIIRTYYRVATGLCLLMRTLRMGSMLQGGNAVIRRAALMQVKVNSTFAFWGEDTELARLLSKIGTVKFSPRLTVLSSGRRLRQQGLFKTGLLYSINYFSTILLKRPFNTTWVDWR